jgi:RNA polymerase sigma-70 factor (ECF subfamily)
VEDQKHISLTPEQYRIFEQEFMPHMDALYNFAYHLSYNETDSEDLVQDTFLRACKSIDSYRQGTNARAWLFTILRNIFINKYRDKVRQPQTVDYEDASTYQDGHVGGAYVDLREELLRDMMGDEVSLALSKLSPSYREVIMLCDIEEFSYEDIANVLDIPIGTVRSRINRARNMLKDELKEYAQSMGFKDKRSKT